MPLPTNRTVTDSIEEHVDDHNTLADQHNELEGHAAATTAVHGIADTAALATQADLTAAIDGLVDAAPGTLDTLNELATALGDDANYASTVTTALAGKASTTHHTTHEPGGSDAMAADASAATASLRTLGTGATQAATGNHSHSGTYEPVATAHHARHEPGGGDAMAVDQAAATASLRTLGTSSTQAAAGNHAHSGAYVAVADLDAKGDLLVASANDAYDNLAVGTNGYVLTADSAQTLGVKWAAASGGAPAEGRALDATYTAGALVVPGIEGTSVATYAMGANSIRYTPWYLATSITLDRLVVEITTAGAAGKVLRLGIYNANTNWQPTSLVLDAGTVAADSLGVKTITINQALAAGRYMACAYSDGAPTLRSIKGGSRYFGLSSTLTSTPFLGLPRSFVGSYGVLPDPASPAASFDVASSTPPDCFVFCRVSTP